MTKINRSYGWLADLPDRRDIMYGTIREISKDLPPMVDLRPGCSPVEDQGDLGSCTANALAGALEFLEMKDKVHFEDLSRLFIYYNEREIEHTILSDSGAQIRDGIKTLAKKGVCSEKTWPYDISKFTVRPGRDAYNEAKNHKITSYSRISTVDEMRMCLAGGFPFVFGFSVYESFESQEVAKTGIVQMPQPGEQQLGGHAVLGVGYDMTKKIFPDSIGSGLSRNSWGDEWGIEGYFWMPLEYLSDRNLSDDFWTIRRANKL